MSDEPRRRSPGTTVWLLVAAVALVAFSARHTLLDQDPRMAPAELRAALQGERPPLVLDVRSPQEFRMGHVPGAVNVPPAAVGRFASTLEDKGQPVVLYCETGSRSRSARYTLRDLGFTDLTQLQGDMSGWRRMGLPVARPAPAG